MPRNHDSTASRISRAVSVNDTHSGLNRTAVSRVLEPRTVEAVARAVRQSRSEGRPLAVGGGRHAMGGQQFLSGGTLLDMRRLNRVRSLDLDRGLLTIGGAVAANIHGRGLTA